MRNTKYNKPAYTGLAKINDLIKMAKRQGKCATISKSRLEFNAEGYADSFKAGYRTLILDKDELGVYSAYIPQRNGYVKLVDFVDEVKAQGIMDELYTNPYYHSSKMYAERCDKLYNGFKPSTYASVLEMELHLKALYEKALVIHKQLQRGSKTFGCAHRYLLIQHKVYKLLNLYTANFTGRIYKFKSKEKLQYNGEWIPGEYIMHYEECAVTKDDFAIKCDSMFGVQINALGGDIIEAKLLSELNLSVLEVPETTIDCIRLINQFMVRRGYFKDLEARDAYIAKLIPFVEDLEALRSEFNRLYVETAESAGYKVTHMAAGSMSAF